MRGTRGDDSAQARSILSGTLSTKRCPSASAITSAAAISVLSSRHACATTAGLTLPSSFKSSCSATLQGFCKPQAKNQDSTSEEGVQKGAPSQHTCAQTWRGAPRTPAQVRALAPPHHTCSSLISHPQTDQIISNVGGWAAESVPRSQETARYIQWLSSEKAMHALFGAD